MMIDILCNFYAIENSDKSMILDLMAQTPLLKDNLN